MGETFSEPAENKQGLAEEEKEQISAEEQESPISTRKKSLSALVGMFLLSVEDLLLSAEDNWSNSVKRRSSAQEETLAMPTPTERFQDFSAAKSSSTPAEKLGWIVTKAPSLWIFPWVH